MDTPTILEISFGVTRAFSKSHTLWRLLSWLLLWAKVSEKVRIIVLGMIMTSIYTRFQNNWLSACWEKKQLNVHCKFCFPSLYVERFESLLSTRPQMCGGTIVIIWETRFLTAVRRRAASDILPLLVGNMSILSGWIFFLCSFLRQSNYFQNELISCLKHFKIRFRFCRRLV